MKELDVVRLKEAFEGLPAGTIGTVVHVYKGPFFEVEFFDDRGNTQAVLFTPAELVMPAPEFTGWEQTEP